MSGSTNSQLTPLHFAAHRLKENVIKLLIAAPGIELNAQDEDGDLFVNLSIVKNTPLHLVVTNSEYAPYPGNRKAKLGADVYYRISVLLIDAIAAAGGNLHLKNLSAGRLSVTPRERARELARSDVTGYIDSK